MIRTIAPPPRARFSFFVLIFGLLLALPAFARAHAAASALAAERTWVQWSSPRELVVSALPHDQTDVSVTATSEGFFVAWLETTPYGAGIMGTRVTREGEVSEPVLLAEVGTRYSRPALASSGDTVLVAWYDYESRFGVWIRRVSAAGIPLDAEPVRIAGASPVDSTRPVPALSWDGENFLVAWPGRQNIMIARITEGGITLDNGGVAIPGGPSQTYPRIAPEMASTGSTTLLAWQEGTVGECRLATCPPWTPSRVVAARLDRNLMLLDPAPFEIAPGRRHAFPAVAANGGVFLLTAVHPQNAAEAIRISAAGEVFDPVPLSDLLQFKDDELRSVQVTAPVLLSAGGVAVTDVPGGFVLFASTSAGFFNEETLEDHARLALVPLVGAPSLPIGLRASWRSLPRPDLAALDDGTTLVVYSGWRDHRGAARPRIAFQMAHPAPSPRRRVVAR